MIDCPKWTTPSSISLTWLVILFFFSFECEAKGNKIGDLGEDPITFTHDKVWNTCNGTHWVLNAMNADQNGKVKLKGQNIQQYKCNSTYTNDM